MRINTNIMAMNTQRQMGINANKTAKSIEKLSSGFRINRAGDDAAGLAISEKMRGQIRGLNQSSRNSQDAISMVQTAEGALQETQAILQRMRELAVQSSNGTNTGSDRSQIQNEITQLTDEINRIGNTTEFNTQRLIDGSKDKTEATKAVKNASSIDKIGVGADLFKVRNAATAGSGTGLSVTAGVTIHDGTAGKLTSGKVTTGGAATELSAAVDATHDELTVKIGNSVRTIVLGIAAADNDAQALDMQVKLRAAFAAGPAGGSDSGAATAGAATISVTMVGNDLVITDGGKGADSKIEIVGGNAADALFDSALDVAENGNAANNQMVINYTKDGGTTPASTTLTLANGTYNDASELVTQIEVQLALDAAADAEIDFSADAVGLGESVKWTTTTAGKDNGITSITGTAAALAGVTEATIQLGEAKNDEITVNVDGDNYTVSIAATDYSDKDILANSIETAVNTAISVAGKTNLISVETLSVADTDRVRFQATSATEGATSNITFTSTELADNLGFDTVAVAGEDGQDASVSYHIGANKGQSLSLGIEDMRASALGISGAAAGASTVTEIDGVTVADVTYATDSSVKNGSDTEYVIDVSSADSANKAIEVINNAIETVSQERAKLGITQNRLEHTIKNLDTSAENLIAAESRIRDVDMAKEMMEFTKNNILQQAAQSMLAQANQAPQGVLQLLR